MKKSLDDIVKTMIKYRGKPENEPLSLVERLLCLCAYFDKSNNP